MKIFYNCAIGGTHRVITVPSLARETRYTCQDTKVLAHKNEVIKKNDCMNTCHQWHKCEINSKNYLKSENSSNPMINIFISTCTHRCEVCGRNNQVNTKIKIVTESHSYHFLKISLSDFQRKQPTLLPKNLGKLIHSF